MDLAGDSVKLIGFDTFFESSPEGLPTENYVPRIDFHLDSVDNLEYLGPSKKFAKYLGRNHPTISGFTPLVREEHCKNSVNDLCQGLLERS